MGMEQLILMINANSFHRKRYFKDNLLISALKELPLEN